AAAMEGLAPKQDLDHLLPQPFDLIHVQQGHDILDRVAMRHRKAKQAFVVLLEPYVLAVLVVLVAREPALNRNIARQAVRWAANS
ncbi:MAG: hypothetical protein ACOYMG_24930, partial [Candidatus Methylumidiphilus sp.]